nr:hypothetical protein [Chromobacterium sp. ASV5]
MPCNERSAEPCIHTDNCHHYREMPHTGSLPGKKLASLVINVFEGKVCEVLIKGDENEIREVIQENISRITSLLAA